MAAKTDESICRLSVEVADDRMQAWIRLVDPADLHSLTLEEIVAAIEEAAIVIDDAVRGRIEEFINLMGEEGDRPKRFLVAEGRPAVEGKDGDLVWHESFEKLERDWQGDARVNYYTFNSINTVETDQPLGTLVRSVPGANGVDVLGNPLTPKGHPQDVQLDSTVRVSDDDSATVLPNCAGKVVYEAGKLSISEVFVVKKNVDFETGNIDSTIDVRIGGTILDRFVVKSQKSVTVCGAIEAATVDAQSDVIVRGGIIQRGEGSVSAGGDIVAKFCDDARMRAAGNVKVANELLNSQVHGMGMLLISQGAIVGGQVYARDGVEVATLGSDGNVPTEITVGTDPNVLREVDQLRESLKPKRQSIERIRQTVQPLMANLKRLSPAQKERATELIFQADEADAEIAEAESEQNETLERARATEVPYVLVSMVIHQGVSIRIGHRKTTFICTIKGPVRIEKRKVRRVTEFVAIDQLSGSVTILQSTQVVEEAFAETGTSI